MRHETPDFWFFQGGLLSFIDADNAPVVSVIFLW